MTDMRPSSSKSPLISIITVTRNARSTVVKTMQSVREQTFEGYEHIVMDGLSTDDTLELVKKYATPKTIVHSSSDLGIYDAMNKALGIARGKYVIFLNSGDSFAAPDTLRRYASAALEGSDVDIVYGQTVLVDEEGNIVGHRHLNAPSDLTAASFKDGMMVCHQAFMARRSIAPLFDIKYRFSADYDWCIICLQNSRRNVYIGDEPAIHYLKDGMTTANHQASLQERFKIMCHYYGTVPTATRHIKFALRYLKRKKLAPNIQ